MPARRHTWIIACFAHLLSACASAAQAPRISLTGYIKSHSMLFDRPLPEHAPQKGRVWIVSNRLRLDLSCKTEGRLAAYASYDLAPQFQDTELAGESTSSLAVDTRTYRLADLESQAYPDAPGTAGSFSKCTVPLASVTPYLVMARSRPRYP